MNVTDIRVGARWVDYDTAHGWVMEYFDADKNLAARRPFAYPAYDHLQTGTEPDKLNDGDLLAPGMLNAPINVAGLYTLQRIRPRLEAALQGTPTTVILSAAVDDGSLRSRMKSFFGVLDEQKPPHIGLTTLTKVLHRKRPKFVPIHDKFVKTCYLGDQGFPVHTTSDRTWADYFADFAAAIDGDIRAQTDALERLREESGALVSLLRILDVIAWNAGKKH